MESRKRFYFFLWELLTNEKELRIIIVTTILFYRKMESTILFFCLYGYNSGGIISIIAFTKSVRQIVDKVVVTYEKGIFYGAVLARERHLF